MPHFTQDEMSDLMMDVMRHASAPPGSTLWATTPTALEALYERGDVADAWIFTTSLIADCVEKLHLDEAKCPCGDPDHLPEVSVSFVPIGANGEPEMDQMIFPTDEDLDESSLPASVVRQLPAAKFLSRLFSAEMAHDNEMSQEIWGEVHQEKMVGDVIEMTVKHVGEIRRQLFGQAGVN
jgi:hypothetical protein